MWNKITKNGIRTKETKEKTAGMGKCTKMQKLY